MPSYVKPSLDVLIDYVKKYDVRVGLRMIYRKFGVPEGERYKYRKLWNAVWNEIPDAFGKGDENACKKSGPAPLDGDSGTLPGEALCPQPGCPEDEETGTP